MSLPAGSGTADRLDLGPSQSDISSTGAFIQNLRRGFYDLGTEAPLASRLADAFAELALVI